MPIVNDTSDSHLKNATMAANAFEGRVTPTVGAGREAIRRAGENAGSAGNLHE